MPIAHKYNSIFIHIPKCAGQSIEKKLMIKSFLLRPSFYFLYGFHGKIQLQHLTPEQMLRLGYVKEDLFNSYFKFCFVRNPYDRAVSDYFWHRDFFREGPPPMYANSFEEYLNIARLHLKNVQHVDDLWCHFLPQYHYVFDRENGSYPDFIGRFENLKSDFAKVAEIIGLSDAVLPHIGKIDRNPYHEYYNQICKTMVEDMYGEDFERFSYPYEIF